MDAFFEYLYQPNSPGLVNWVILPILIFFARLLDVSLGTMRLIFTAKGKHILAPILGFFEVLCWVLIASQLIRNIHSVGPYIGYAGGFAFGTYVGMFIERKLAMGMVMMRIIVPQGGPEIAAKLHEHNLGVTVLEAQGSSGSVKLLYSIVNRRDLPMALKLVKEVNPHAFTSVEPVSETYSGIFPTPTLRPSNWLRKGK